MSANTSWAFAGNAVYAGCQWLVFVMLVKMLPLADVGQFAYWIAVTGPVFILANVRLRNLLATGIATPHGFTDYLAARLVTTSSAVAVAIVIAVAGSGRLDAVVALIAMAKACDALSDICHGLFQRQLEMRTAAIGLMTNGLLSVTFVAVSLGVSPSLTAAMGAYAAASLLALFAWDLRKARRSLARVPLRGAFLAVRHLLWRALPLGLSSAVGSLQTQAPRYAIAAHLGSPALAVFAALAYVPTVGNLIVNAVAQAALPVLSRDLAASRDRYTRRLLRLVALGGAVGVASVVAAALLGRQLLTLMYHAEYAAYLDVLLLLMCASAVSYLYVFLGTATTARGRFGTQFALSCAGLLVISIALVPFVKLFGLPGAAFALLCGAVVETAGYVVVTLIDLGSGRHTSTLAPVLAEGLRS